MPLYRTDAIVLGATDFDEAHRIVTLLTPSRGKLRAVAKGVRRPTSRLAAALLPFTHARLLLWEGRSLDGISQAEIRQSFRPLREDLGRMAPALYACELAGEIVPEGEEGEREGPAAFRLLLDTLSLIAFGGRPDLALRFLELHLLRLSGSFPRLDGCAACGGPVELPAYFSPAAGGCLCAGCRRSRGADDLANAPLPPAPGDGAAGARWLGRGAAAAARALLHAPPRRIPHLAVPPAAARSLGEVTEEYLRFVLQKRLKSLEFLDILSAASGSPAKGGT